MHLEVEEVVDHLYKYKPIDPALHTVAKVLDLFSSFCMTSLIPDREILSDFQEMKYNIISAS